MNAPVRCGDGGMKVRLRKDVTDKDIIRAMVRHCQTSAEQLEGIMPKRRKTKKGAR